MCCLQVAPSEQQRLLLELHAFPTRAPPPLPHLAMASACRCLILSRMLLSGLISILWPLPSRSRAAVSAVRECQPGV